MNVFPRALRIVPALVAGTLLLVLAPLLGSFSSDTWETWHHLWGYLLPEALLNTFALLLLVLLGVTIAGVGAAAAVAFIDFPGRRIFRHLMVVPMAIPTYIYAFVALEFLDYSGPVQGALRHWGLMPTSGIYVRGLMGLSSVLVLALTPYVYLFVLQSFEREQRQLLEAGSTLGLSFRQRLWRLALPLAAPSLIGAWALVSMEVVSDFGAVSAFQVSTLTTVLYRTWTGLSNWAVASQLALVLLTSVGLVAALRGFTFRSRRYSDPSGTGVGLDLIRPPLPLRILLVLAALWWVGLTLVLPLGRLIYWALGVEWQALMGVTLRTFALAAAGATLISVFALMAVLVTRGTVSAGLRVILNVANLGYVVPGLVMGVGMLGVAEWLGLASELGGLSFVVPFAFLAVGYLLRFYSLGYQSLLARSEKVSLDIESVATTLGASPPRILTQLMVPLLRPGVFLCFFLAFIEVIKELPLTLMLRPVGWDTLAVKIYQYTAEGLYSMAAGPALLVVALAVAPTLWLIRGGER